MYRALRILGGAIVAILTALKPTPAAKPMSGPPSNACAAPSPAQPSRTNASRSMTAGRSCIDIRGGRVVDARNRRADAADIQSPDYRGWLTTEEVFLMATSHSARVLGMEDRISRLAPDYEADIAAE